MLVVGISSNRSGRSTLLAKQVQMDLISPDVASFAYSVQVYVLSLSYCLGCSVRKYIAHMTADEHDLWILDHATNTYLLGYSAKETALAFFPSQDNSC